MLLDIAEDDTAVVAQCFVVVAGNEHHPLAVARPAQQFLHHRVLGLRPADTAAHRPEVDDVANQVSLLSRVFAQEIEKPVGLARPGAKMNIGEKNGSDLGHDRRLRPAHDSPVTSSLSFCFAAPGAGRYACPPADKRRGPSPCDDGPRRKPTADR